MNGQNISDNRTMGDRPALPVGGGFLPERLPSQPTLGDGRDAPAQIRRRLRVTGLDGREGLTGGCGRGGGGGGGGGGWQG